MARTRSQSPIAKLTPTKRFTMSRISKAGIDPEGEQREGTMPMQLPDFPRWLRALLAVLLILFFFNALYALAFFTAIWQLRIDPGVATLMGASPTACTSSQAWHTKRSSY